ncbi:MAG: hypothetical protein R2860_07335 [Desulfobacterales bacterium]
MDYIPIRIQAAAGGGRFSLNRSLNISMDISTLFQRVSSKDVMMFTLDLHALLHAGLPVDKALSILINVAEKAKFKTVIAGILKMCSPVILFPRPWQNIPEFFPRCILIW